MRLRTERDRETNWWIRRLQVILNFELDAIMRTTGAAEKILRLQAILGFELVAIVRTEKDPTLASCMELRTGRDHENDGERILRLQAVRLRTGRDRENGMGM
jgi:hypothetical protein